MNIRITAMFAGDAAREESTIVAITNETRWFSQFAYLEDCGWENIESEETTEAADVDQDGFDDVFDLNRDD